ncbi:DUF2878 domain-containing protein [Shewanella sp. UCD-KL21]|uniref:DUF2878 domain-containing protein n=1 Tax=Shewanella sp. UCD-KL21 TaxID=1917164 RepID=UPI0009707467|nr:DUF2878 domain-containing protein [Shewanella sp. UCD-KL21]
MLWVNHNIIINVIAFQIIWWAGVLAGNQLLYIPGLLLIWHFIVSRQRALDFKVMLSCTIIGVLIDLTLTLTGLFSFTVVPIWLLLLWCYFAISLNYSLGFFSGLPIIVQVLVGGVFGSLSYLAGANFGAVDFPHGDLFTTAILAMIWALLMPLFLYIAKFIRHKHEVKQISQLI